MSRARHPLAGLPARPRDGHKGSFGTALVVAGSHDMLGAAILCATAALRAGAGLVQVCVPSALQPLVASAQPCATTIARTQANLRAALAKADAVVVGPGLGQTPATRRLGTTVLRFARGPIVLDADALNALAPLQQPLATRVPVVLTPHPGEAGRLLGSDAAAVQEDRHGALDALVALSGGVVALKGHRTLVGDGDRTFENRTGNPGMATGGSGDVLAGLIGALLAQGLPPYDAACFGVHVHGRAGDRVARRVGETGLIASDLPAAIAEELR